MDSMTGQGCLLPVDWNEKKTGRKVSMARRDWKSTLLVVGVHRANGLVDLPVDHHIQKSFLHLYRIDAGRFGWYDDLGSDHDTRRLNFSSVDMSDHYRPFAGHTDECGQQQSRGLGFTSAGSCTNCRWPDHRKPAAVMKARTSPP